MTRLPPELEVALLLLVLVAAIYDLRYRRIPNWLCAAALILGVALNIGLSQWAGLRQAGLGTALAFAVYFPLFVLRAMGAGDLKLMAAVGAIVGPSNWFAIFIFTALLGGAVALALLLVRGGLIHAFRNVRIILVELAHFRPPHRINAALDIAHPRAVTLPHAISICFGSLAFVWLSHLRNG